MFRHFLKTTRLSSIDLCRLATLVLGACLLPYYRYLLTGDGIAYITIAQHYLNGDLSAAVNGYWSPLFSWLLVPLMAVGVEGLLAFKIVNLLLGVWAVGLVGEVLRGLNVTNQWRLTAMIATIPLVLFYAFYICTPDLLVVCMLLWYFNLFDGKSGKFLPGIVGSVAFLAKAYCFWFFIAHFTVMTIIKLLKGERRAVIRNWLVSMVIFLLISGAWIGVMSSKYNEIVISYAYGYSKHSMLKQGEPFVFSAGLLTPPNEGSINILEDYTGLKLEKWSAFDSQEYFNFQLGMVKWSLTQAWNYLGHHGLLIILISGLFWVYHVRKGLFSASIHTRFLSFAGIYVGGYSLMIMQFRYLWIIEVLLLIMAVVMLTHLMKRLPLNVVQRYVVMVGVVLVFGYSPVRYLVSSANQGKALHELVEEVSGELAEKGNVASVSAYVKSLYFCYHMQLPYYGIPAAVKHGEELTKTLQDHDIRYILVWNSEKPASEIEGYTLTYTNRGRKLQVLTAAAWVK